MHWNQLPTLLVRAGIATEAQAEALLADIEALDAAEWEAAVPGGAMGAGRPAPPEFPEGFLDG